MVGHTRSAHAKTVEQLARTAPVEGFSVSERVAYFQTIEKIVESSRSSPETGAGEGIESPLRLQHSALCKQYSQFCNITGSVNTHL